MKCDEVRRQLLDAVRGRLDGNRQGEVAVHLERCPPCAAAAAGERALDEVLARELPRYAAPPSLKRRLALMAGPGAPERRAARATRRAVPAIAAAAVLLLAVGGTLWWQRDRAGAADPLTAELVNDHLRVLARERPVDVESRGSHEVKPWFEGRLDFAPVVPDPAVPELRLRGGAVGYVFDRKAAVVLYSLRLHAVTMFAFREEGLPSPGGRVSAPGAVRRRAVRGFTVASWRAGDLGYALVSDVNPAELVDLATRFAAATQSLAR